MKRKLFSGFILITIIVFGVFSVRNVFANNYQLSGSVKDNSGVVISGATINIYNTGTTTDAVSPVTTDSSGNYSVSVPAGTYDIKATPPSGSNYSPSIYLRYSISTDSTLNFTLIPSGTVAFTGHIYDALGNPLQNQSFILRRTSNNSVVGSTTTDSSGSFSIQVSPSSYNIQITATNSLSVSAPAYYSLYSNNYSLQQSTNLDFLLPLKKVTVHVQDQSNQSVSNSEIRTQPTSPINSSMSLGNGLTASSVTSYYGSSFAGAGPLTDQNGNAILWLLPTDISHTYSFTAVAPTGSNLTTTTLSNQSITNDTNLQITMYPPVTLSGHIYDPLGNPLQNQTVSIRQPGTNTVVANTSTDSTGSYSISVGPNTYTLQVGATNSLSTNAPGYYTFWVSNYSLTQNTTLDFSPPFKQVTIHVQDVFNNPVSNSQIQTSPTSPVNTSLALGNGLTSYQATSYYGSSLAGAGPLTDQNGNVTLWLFPTDASHTYSFTAKAPSGSNFINTTVSNVSVTADMQKTITISQSPVTFSGHIYDPLGNPLQSQTVKLRQLSDNSLVATSNTDSQGVFSLQAAPNTYKITVEGTNNTPVNAPGYYIFWINNYALSQTTSLDFTLPFKKVTVHVQDLFNNPVGNIQVQTSPSTPINTNLSMGNGLTAYQVSSYYTSSTGPNTDQTTGNAILWLAPNDASHTYSLVAVPPTGSIYTQMTVDNINVTQDQTDVISLQYSHSAPVTTATLSPNPDGNGNYSDPTTVTLSATAASGYTVPAGNTYYTIDGGSQQTYTTPFTVSGNGSHTIIYWSIDNSGVIETHKTTNFTILNSFTLSGTVFNDDNQNGVHDAGELGYSGRTVTLSNNQTATTDNNGVYTFNNLTSGSYTVTLSMPSGYSFTTTNPVTLPISADRTQNFGVHPNHNMPGSQIYIYNYPGVSTGYPNPSYVTLTSTAASGYSIDQTYYTVDGGSVQTYSGMFTVTGEGSHSIVFWTVDNTGVEELPHHTEPFTIDSTATNKFNFSGTGTDNNNGTITANFTFSNYTPSCTSDYVNYIGLYDLTQGSNLINTIVGCPSSLTGTFTLNSTPNPDDLVYFRYSTLDSNSNQTGLWLTPITKYSTLFP